MNQVLVLMLAIQCPATKMINRSKQSWTKWDKTEMHYAQKRCGEIYPGYGCLKRFYKLGYHDYFALCGKP